MIYLSAAYHGFCETMQAILGSPDEQPTGKVSRDAAGKPIEFTPQVFDIHFGDVRNRQPRRK